MEWNYTAVTAFATASPAFDTALARLMQNQAEIENAFKPFYGREAGGSLTELPKKHIGAAVAAVKAATAGDKAATDKAIAVAHAIAHEIANFPAAANSHRPRKTRRAMLKRQIDTTPVHATALLQRKYADGIAEFGKAETHLMMLADALTHGPITAFPTKFPKKPDDGISAGQSSGRSSPLSSEKEPPCSTTH